MRLLTAPLATNALSSFGMPVALTPPTPATQPASLSSNPRYFLDSLGAGHWAVITSIQVSDSLLPRLQAMGIKTGVAVQCIRRAPFNGPMHIRVGLTDLIIRKQDAAMLAIQLAQATL